MNQKKQMDTVKALPIDRREDWVMERRPIDMEIEELGDVKPEVLVCVSATTELVVGANVVPPGAPQSEIASWALDCMLSPMVGKACRPMSVTLVGLKELRPTFEQLGIQVTARSLPHPVVDEVVSTLQENISSPGLPPYLMDRSLQPSAVAEFFGAAAECYRAQPWEQFEDEIPIKLCIHYKKPVEYWAIVMGAEGETFGLSLYRSPQDIMNIFDAEDDAAAMQVGKQTWSMAVNFEAAEYAGPAAMAECMTNEWELAGDLAYPSAVVVDPGGEDIFRGPNQQELLDLAVAAGAVAQFVTANKEDIKDELDVEETIEIESSGAKVKVDLEFPAPEFLEEEEWVEGDDDESDEN